MLPSGRSLWKVPADGNCFFHCVRAAWPEAGDLNHLRCLARCLDGWAEEDAVARLAAELDLCVAVHPVALENLGAGLQTASTRVVGSRAAGRHIDLVHWTRNGAGLHFDVLAPLPEAALTAVESIRESSPSAPDIERRGLAESAAEGRGSVREATFPAVDSVGSTDQSEQQAEMAKEDGGRHSVEESAEGEHQRRAHHAASGVGARVATEVGGSVSTRPERVAEVAEPLGDKGALGVLDGSVLARQVGGPAEALGTDAPVRPASQASSRSWGFVLAGHGQPVDLAAPTESDESEAAAAPSDAADEDELSEDEGFTGEGLLAGECLPTGGDGDAIFYHHVDGLLATFRDGGDAMAYLSGLPQYSPACECIGPRAALQRFEKGVDGCLRDRLHSGFAMGVRAPLWRTHNYVLAVLCAGLHRCTGLPDVFYFDALEALCSSLLHKSVHVRMGGWEARARRWVADTADPGAGKSPALDPLVELLRQVLQEEAEFAPGCEREDFHLQEATTHAAAVHRLHNTDGYALIATAEAGPMLCPQGPSVGSWDQSKFINYQRLLDAANGGQVKWETMLDRGPRKKAAPPKPRLERTNLTIVFIQQLSILRNWWARSEALTNVGLAARFSLGFGQDGPPGPTCLANFAAEVAWPLRKEISRAILRQLGPKTPHGGHTDLWSWRMEPASLRFLKAVRCICFQAKKANLGSGHCARAALGKVEYWVAQQSLLASIYAQILPGLLRRSSVKVSDARITFPALRLGTDFYWMRYLFGLVAVDTDVALRTWTLPAGQDPEVPYRRATRREVVNCSGPALDMACRRVTLVWCASSTAVFCPTAARLAQKL